MKTATMIGTAAPFGPAAEKTFLGFVSCKVSEVSAAEEKVSGIWLSVGQNGYKAGARARMYSTAKENKAHRKDLALACIAGLPQYQQDLINTDTKLLTEEKVTERRKYYAKATGTYVLRVIEYLARCETADTGILIDEKTGLPVPPKEEPSAEETSAAADTLAALKLPDAPTYLQVEALVAFSINALRKAEPEFWPSDRKVHASKGITQFLAGSQSLAFVIGE